MLSSVKNWVRSLGVKASLLGHWVLGVEDTDSCSSGLQQMATTTLSKKEQHSYCRCTPRVAHVAFTDGDNMYIHGGYYKTADDTRDVPTNELMIFNSTLNCWFMKVCDWTFPTPSLQCSSCAVIYPYAYFISGFITTSGHISSVFRLHLPTFTWERMPVDDKSQDISPRDKHATWVYKDKIYCFGGWGPSPAWGGLNENGDWFEGSDDDVWHLGWNNQLLIFDPSTSHWTNPKCNGPVPLPRAAHSASLVGDCVYIYGGRHGLERLSDIHRLDLKTLTWSGRLFTKGCEGTPIGRSWHTASVISDHEIFIFGGFDSQKKCLGDGWMFDTRRLSWKPVVKHHSNPRLWHTAVVTSNKDVLVYGGCKGSILDEGLSYEYFSDQIIKFQFQPNSLFKICRDYIAENSRPHSWEDMHEPLRSWLIRKQAILSVSRKEESQPYRKIHQVGRTSLLVRTTKPILNGFEDTTGDKAAWGEASTVSPHRGTELGAGDA